MNLLKFHPILFQTEMVQANLAGNKTQTRRTTGFNYINENPDAWIYTGTDIDPTYIIGEEKWGGDKLKDYKGLYAEFEANSDFDFYQNIKCPYGQPGDILWVRETWKPIYYIPNGYTYKANAHPQMPKKGWKPSIHMPKEACRIFLLLKEVNVERLQDISEEDAKAEGVKLSGSGRKYLNYRDNRSRVTQFVFNCDTAKESFKTLWWEINGFRDEPFAWFKNPYVWVLKYEVLATNGTNHLWASLFNKGFDGGMIDKSIKEFLKTA